MRDGSRTFVFSFRHANGVVPGSSHRVDIGRAGSDRGEKGQDGKTCGALGRHSGAGGGITCRLPQQAFRSEASHAVSPVLHLVDAWWEALQRLRAVAS